MGDLKAWDSLGQINLFMPIENELEQFFDPENDSIEQIIQLLGSNE